MQNNKIEKNLLHKSVNRLNVLVIRAVYNYIFDNRRRPGISWWLFVIEPGALRFKCNHREKEVSHPVAQRNEACFATETRKHRELIT
ncbi:hypothetical protein SAMN04488023_13037 [Pedobacter rhizosphaerae]|uniref:Uncharacterized protein n=1 Tax=Pedobacter rhizosphaerae TaxID=390241 RepID=A0A1H9UF96_9SPHI|nr:hypothetical protein SAMN04488023_13037 [Pedobacter rhizosphaerae]